MDTSFIFKTPEEFFLNDVSMGIISSITYPAEKIANGSPNIILLCIIDNRDNLDILSKSGNRRIVTLHPRPVIGSDILQI